MEVKLIWKVSLNEKDEIFYKSMMITIEKTAPMRQVTKKEQFYYEKYKFYRDKLNHLIRKNEKKSLHKIFNDSINNVISSWNEINNIINKISSKSDICCNVITKPLVVINNFNNYFSTSASGGCKEVSNKDYSKFFDYANHWNFFYSTSYNPKRRKKHQFSRKQ